MHSLSHIDFQILSRDRKVNLDWIISIGSSFSLSSLLACFLACFLHGGDHLQRALGNCVTTEAAARDAFRNGRPLDSHWAQGQGPLRVAMAAAVVRNITILTPPSVQNLFKQFYSLWSCAQRLPHRLGGSAPCTAETEGCSVGSVSNTDSTQNPGSAHPWYRTIWIPS